MKRTITAFFLIGVLLAGCADTQVYIPYPHPEVDADTVVRIPVKPEQEAATEPEPTQIQTEPMTEPATEPEPTQSATVTKKPSSTSSNKGSGTQSGSNQGTITGSGQKPAATEPATEPATESESPETQPEATEPPLYDISGYVPGATEYALLEQVNGYRIEAGLPALGMDDRLCAIASCRSYEISRIWSHSRPDGRWFATVLSDYSYRAAEAEELLVYALGFADGTAMADRWMESDTHRQLLMDDWAAVGVGLYEADGYIYVTCLLVR